MAINNVFPNQIPTKGAGQQGGSFNAPVSKVISGALLKVFINEVLYAEVNSVSYTIDYGTTQIYGIDSPFAQEIAPTRYSVSGSISGLRLKLSGGLQGYAAVFRYDDLLSSPYVSIRLQERSQQEDILYIPNAMVGSQSLQAGAKGTALLSFNFTGLIGLEPLDRVNKGSGIPTPNLTNF